MAADTVTKFLAHVPTMIEMPPSRAGEAPEASCRSRSGSDDYEESADSFLSGFGGGCACCLFCGREGDGLRSAWSDGGLLAGWGVLGSRRPTVASRSSRG